MDNSVVQILNLDRKRKVLSSNKMDILLIAQSPIANSFLFT